MCNRILRNKRLDSRDFLIEGGNLGGIGNEGEKLLIGGKRLREKAGLLLELGEVVEILGFGRVEVDGVGKVIDSLRDIALTSID